MCTVVSAGCDTGWDGGGPTNKSVNVCLLVCDCFDLFVGGPQTATGSGGEETAARCGRNARLPCWGSCSKEGHSVWFPRCQGDRFSRRTGVRRL